MTENKGKPKIAIVGGGRNAGRTMQAQVELLARIDELEAYKAIGSVEYVRGLQTENAELHCELQAINALAEERDKAIRAKVIDEFAELLKPVIDEKIKGWTNSDDLRRWCENSIDKIAAQMKEGAV